MTHRFLCIPAVLLLCCGAFGQDPAPAPLATAPGVTSTAVPEVQEFQKIEDKWTDAVNGRDQYGLELVLSPLYVGISASGDISTRNQQLADVISDPDKTLHLDQRVITVRMLGDIAVANGTYVLHHKLGNNEVDEKGVFTHVFERGHNSWVCVNSQRTLLREDGPQGKGKKKQSQAELPFHIPLFSKQ
jgi:ketosteroid isomerase-like protein